MKYSLKCVNTVTAKYRAVQNFRLIISGLPYYYINDTVVWYKLKLGLCLFKSRNKKKTTTLFYITGGLVCSSALWAQTGFRWCNFV